MIDPRLLLLAVALFGGAFVGVSLMPKGSPSVAMRTAPAQPDTQEQLGAAVAKKGTPVAETAVREPDKTLSPDPAPAEVAMLRDNVIDPDRIRITAIQAATAYALAPCDTINKAAFVVAASTYWRTAAGRDDAPASASPMDERVRQAMQAALKAGGIAAQDFPAESDPWTMAGMQSRREIVPACAGARRAERR